MPSNLERKARRKRQTQLTFDPLEQSSSPSTKSPAKVRYQLNGARRTRASGRQNPADDFEGEYVLSSAKKEESTPAPQKMNGKLPFKPLPTPAKSSQPQAQAESSDELVIDYIPKPTPQTRSVPKFLPTVGKNKKEYSLGLDGAYSSESEAEASITPSKKKSSAKKTTIFSLVTSDEDAPLVTPTRKSNTKGSSARPTRSTQSSDSKGKSRNSNTKPIAPSDSDDDELVSLSELSSARKRLTGRSTRSLPRLRTYGKHVVNTGEDESDDDPIVSSPKRSQKPSYQVRQADEDEDEEEIRPSPLKRRRRQPFIEENDDDDDDDDDEIHLSHPKRRPRQPLVKEEDEDVEPVISPLKRSRPTIESEPSSEEDVSPAKRRRQATQRVDSDSGERTIRSRTSRGWSGGSQSTTPQRTTRQRTGKRKHRTEREKKMEILRRKRNGDARELTDSESDSEYDEDDFEKLEVFDDEEAPVRKPAKGKQKAAVDAGDIDSDNFVTDDDEDGDLGIPGMSSIPLEFTHQAHKRLHHHFKDAVEWMVHNKINPAFPRDDPIYKTAFRKLDDECSALAKSKFSSTQWTKEFTRAVYARPILETLPLQHGEGFDVASGLPKCFACNHRKHQPSKIIVFSGKAYDKDTLEELDQGSSDSSSNDSSDNDETKSLNSNGQEIPSPSTRYAVGSVCHDNAERSHLLIHWKYNLNQWVIDALENDGELTAEKLAEREALNLKKRTRYANAVVDRWDASTEIKQLWGDYKRQLNSAREVKPKGRGGWQ